MSLRERVFGLETEYAINFYPANAGIKPDAQTIVQALQEVLTKEYGIAGSQYLVTGAKFHHDVGHAEWAQPECRTAREAAAYDKGADNLLARILPQTQETLDQRGYQGHLLIAKNNVDPHGNTYGCHENYLMLRDTELLTGEHFLRYLARCLIPFLVTRQLFAGAGRLVSTSAGRSGQLTFEISQRAAFIDTLVSKETTSDRPIFNIGREGESLAVGNYRRLHQILGDANVSGWATWMKMGTTAIILRMIEDLFIIDNPLLQDPLTALRSISRDNTCRVPLLLRDGKSMSALDIQWSYYERADSYLDEFGYSDEENALMEAWEEALKDITEDPMRLRNRADWVIKKRFLDAYLAQAGISWAAAANDQSMLAGLQAYDLRYHDVSGEGLYNQFYKPDTLLTEAEIQAAQQNPPPYTRARIRGEAIRLAQQYSSSVGVENWQEVQVDGVKISLTDPLEFDHPQFTASWETPIHRLEKACEAHPDDAQKHHELGCLYLNEALYEQAIKAFIKVVKLQPEERTYAANLALALMYQGWYEEAIRWSRRANQLTEDKRLLRYNTIGLAYLYLGRYQEAMLAFRQQISINPESEVAMLAYENLGMVFLKLGQIADAEQQFLRVLEWNSNQLQPLVALGVIQMSRGDSAQAIKLLKSAASLPQDVVTKYYTRSAARYLQAIAHIALENEGGLRLLQEALKQRNPPAADGLFLLNPLLILLSRALRPPRDIQQAFVMVEQAEEMIPQTSQTEADQDIMTSEPERAWWRELVTHKDIHLRMRAATYLGWRKSSTALTLLNEMAQHDVDEKVRLAAVKALGTIKNDVATSILLTYLSDKSPLVRWTAQEALEEMNLGEPVQPAPVIQPASDDGEQIIQLLS